VRADLRRYAGGLSLGDMFAGRVTPDEVWDCIAHFPRESATTSALYDEAPLSLEGEAAEPRLSEYSPERQSLDLIADRLATLITVVIRLGGGDAPQAGPLPRPGDARRAALKEKRREQARGEWAEQLRLWGIGREALWRTARARRTSPSSRTCRASRNR
jgi:hypothetical protein